MSRIDEIKTRMASLIDLDGSLEKHRSATKASLAFNYKHIDDIQYLLDEVERLEREVDLLDGDLRDSGWQHNE
ncbi:MAG: hypothetical protein JKY81_01700 [Colwellia sp.]|nr:hypothetical protein [Colwellia sp.]